MNDLPIVFTREELDRHDRRIQIKALNDAASHIYADDGPGSPLSVATWLRDRAAALAAPVERPVVNTYNPHCPECGVHEDLHAGKTCEQAVAAPPVEQP